MAHESAPNPGGKKESTESWLTFVGVTTAWPHVMNRAYTLQAALATKGATPTSIDMALKSFQSDISLLKEGPGAAMGKDFPVHNAKEIIANVEAGNYEAAAEGLESFTTWAKGANDAFQFIANLPIG